MTKTQHQRGHPVYADMARTIFDVMSGRARETGAINLGQGFPDDNGPPELIAAAQRALVDQSNQYPPSAGVPALRGAVSAWYDRRQRLAIAPENVVITSGATEALAAAILAVVRPGDEVILFAPSYDAYAPLVRRAGGTPVFVTLRPPAWSYDRAAIEAAITPRTVAMIVNDPLNPTGSVTDPAERAMLARLCVAHDLIAICDEVWEEVRFDGAPHRSLLAEPGMADRTIKIGSAGKIFGLTGWKIGWMCAATGLAGLLARAHQFLTYTSAPCLQHAVAEGLALPDAWFEQRLAQAAARRDRLIAGLRGAGFAVLPNAATWFVCVDLAASGIVERDGDWCARMIDDAGVASIPVSAFYESGGKGARQGRAQGVDHDAGHGADNIVRFCHAKPVAMLDDAVARLRAARDTGRLR